MSVSDVKAPGGQPGKPVLKPTKPGQPVAPPQPETEGSDPTVPTAPTPELPPEIPTDPNNPSDPTVPVDATTLDAVLELPPEGMLRISKASERDQFVFPVHAERWAAAGWKVHPPVTIEAMQADLPELPLESLLVPAPGEIPEEVVTVPGELPEEGVTLPGEIPEEVITPPASMDYNAMTKSQIIAEVEASYGVVLDSALIKAELVAQAEALAAEDAATNPEPPAVVDPVVVEPEATIPTDLLG